MVAAVEGGSAHVYPTGASAAAATLAPAGVGCPDDGSWSCAACTFENERGSSACLVCRVALPPPPGHGAPGLAEIGSAVEQDLPVPPDELGVLRPPGPLGGGGHPGVEQVRHGLDGPGDLGAQGRFLPLEGGGGSGGGGGAAVAAPSSSSAVDEEGRAVRRRGASVMVAVSGGEGLGQLGMCGREKRGWRFAWCQGFAGGKGWE